MTRRRLCWEATSLEFCCHSLFDCKIQKQRWWVRWILSPWISRRRTCMTNFIDQWAISHSDTLGRIRTMLLPFIKSYSPFGFSMGHLIKSHHSFYFKIVKGKYAIKKKKKVLIGYLSLSVYDEIDHPLLIGRIPQPVLQRTFQTHDITEITSSPGHDSISANQQSS